MLKKFYQAEESINLILDTEGGDVIKKQFGAAYGSNIWSNYVFFSGLISSVTCIKSASIINFGLHIVTWLSFVHLILAFSYIVKSKTQRMLLIK